MVEVIEKDLELKEETAYQLEKLALNWVDGEWLDSDKHGISYNPATGEPIGRFADGGQREAGKAIAASRAFHETAWKNDHALRGNVLLAIAGQIEARSQDLIQMLGIEGGKIAAEATMEVYAAPAFLRYWAGKTFTAGRSGEARPGSLSVTIREAVGVAGIIAPFNAPVALAFRALAPALAAGTTTVIKLPGLTAQTNKLLYEIISQTPGLPISVVNMITESGDEAAKFLVQSPHVPVISFTGSTRTGRVIVAAGAAHLKRFNLELGGKTPLIIFNDADIETAIFTMEKAITIFSGQFCMTGSRILVQRDVADKIRQGLANRLHQVKIGPPSDFASEMGTMINKQHVQRVNKLVDEAIAAGAKVIVRGGPFTEGALARGAFYKPTLLEITNP